MAATAGKGPKNTPTPSIPRICKFKKGDRLQVITGRHAQHKPIGTLQSIDKRKGRLLIEGVNKVFKHRKQDPSKKITNGIEQIEAPIHVSNVALVCPKCYRTTRVGWRILDERKADGKIQKVRICRRCQERIDD